MRLSRLIACAAALLLSGIFFVSHAGQVFPNSKKMYLITSPNGFAIQNTMTSEEAPQMLVAKDKADKNQLYSFHADEDDTWVALTADSGKAILAEAGSHLAFSALHYTDEAIWSVTHDFELPSVRLDETVLYLDAVQQGLGNNTCGPQPLEKYMIPENEKVTLKFRMISE